MSGSPPNKVALTILAGLALIGLFAVTQSGVAILAIARFGATFNQIAETNLPALIASSRMSELSQTLVAAAPEIALADTQLRRQTIEDQLNDRVAALVRTVARLDGAAVDQEQVSEMRRQLDELFVNLKGLNELVRERIDATNALEAVMARLPRLAARVRRSPTIRSSVSRIATSMPPRRCPMPTGRAWSSGRRRAWSALRSCWPRRPCAIRRAWSA